MVKPRNIKLILAYDGRGFSGYQFQPNQRTIQGELEKALKQVTGQKITTYAAGRTDAGVHAEGQVVNFKIVNNLPPQKYRNALNFYLPDDIRIGHSEEVGGGFHSRYDAIYRQYQYAIANHYAVLDQRRQWYLEGKLNFALLSAVASYILGYHDFSTFCVVSSQKENNDCIVYKSRWRFKDGSLIYDISANRFLHTMIRSLVGLMVRTARNEISMKEFEKIFESGNHGAIKTVAPAHGLCLVSVAY